MSITTVFNFDNPSDYTLNNIDAANDVASLSLVANPSQTFSQPLTSSSGFTFNSTKTAISGGLLSQKSQLILPTFTHLVNAVSNNPGELTKTAGGSDYNAGANSAQSLSASGAFQVTAGAAFGPICGLSTLANTNGDYTAINYGIDFVSGDIIILELGIQVAINITTYVPGDIFRIEVSGTTVTYLKNGVVFYTSLVAASFPLYLAISIYQQDDTIAGLMLQMTAAEYLADNITFPSFNYSGLGAIIGFSGFSTAGDSNSPGYILNDLYWNGGMWVSSNGTYAQSNGKAMVAANIASFPNNNSVTIKVVTQDSRVQMAITGPLVITYSGQIYPMSGGTVLSNSALTMKTLISFAANYSESGSDTVTFALQVNNVLRYWNGSAWVTSNGTYAQTNTASIILANLMSLLTVNSLVKVYALLISGNGSTSPNLTSMTLVYNFGTPAPTALATTIVYGFLADIVGEPVENVQIIFSLINKIPNAYMAGGDQVLVYSTVTALTDENGFFEQPVIATTQFEGTNTFIQVMIRVSDSNQETVGANRQPLYLTIPIQASIDITTLLTA